MSSDTLHCAFCTRDQHRPRPGRQAATGMRDDLTHQYRRRMQQLVAAVALHRVALPSATHSSACAGKQQLQRTRAVVAGRGQALPQTDAEYLAMRREYELQGFVVRRRDYS